MNESEDTPSERVRFAATLAAVVAGALFLLFLPLLIAGFEHFVFGSNHWEDLLRKIHLHEPLSQVYRPVGDLIRWIRYRRTGGGID